MQQRWGWQCSRRELLAGSVMAGLALGVPGLRAGYGETVDPAPLGVLTRFLGAWHTQTRIRHEDPPQRESQTVGQAECRTTLEGRYAEFRTWSIPPGEVDLQIMTYDVKAGLYRQWVFDADGYRHGAAGRWDPITSTLRWEGQVESASFVIDDRWVSADRLEWTLRRTGANGRQLQTINGLLERCKEQ